METFMDGKTYFWRSPLPQTGIVVPRYESGREFRPGNSRIELPREISDPRDFRNPEGTRAPDSLNVGRRPRRLLPREFRRIRGR